MPFLLQSNASLALSIRFEHLLQFIAQLLIFIEPFFI